MFRAHVGFTRSRTLPAMKLLTKENEALVKDINKDVKNKFRWSWLERTITLTVKIGKNTEDVVEKLGDYIAKCDVPGKAQCLYCDDTINYRSRGCVALVEHATKGKKHAAKVALRRTNYSLGSAFVIPSTSSASVNASELTEYMTRPSSTCKPLTALSDRKAHSEVGCPVYLHNIKSKIMLTNCECLCII